MGITVVGLGPGDARDITRRAWDVLAGAAVVYLRTERHPSVPDLPEGPVYRSFDHLYEQHDRFEDVYRAIVKHLLDAAADDGRTVYAVPGDPAFAEHTVTLLRDACTQAGIGLTLVHGVSYVEPSLALLGIDGSDGVQLLDALDVAELYHPPMNPDAPALLAQMYSRMVASEVKLTLMNQYPPEHPVTIIVAAGTSEAKAIEMPLYQIDHHEHDHLTSLYVPPIDSDAVTGFEGFQNTMAHLRAPEGCPWDQKQDHHTLLRYLLEESYEFIDAVELGDIEEMRDELGDLLLQVVFHAQIATEEAEFTMADVIRAIDTKLKRRHPHVWGDVDVNGSADQVVTNWDAIKAEERAGKGEPERGLLDGIPRSMPALAQAHEYDQRARKVGFDWPDLNAVVAKVHEEIAEIQEARTQPERFAEVGDLLLVIAVWARWLDVEPEAALKAANKRFHGRFAYVERSARAQGRALDEMTPEEIDTLWNEAKQAEREGRL